jgi:hypothetical protein
VWAGEAGLRLPLEQEPGARSRTWGRAAHRPRSSAS